jgi:DNA-binding transcriptional regulator YdaS (Cro superfamily)
MTITQALIRAHALAGSPSQTWIAERLGVRPPSVSRWLNGDQIPSAGRVLQMARLLGARITESEVGSGDYWVERL